MITQYDGMLFEFHVNDHPNGAVGISRTFTVSGSGFGYNAGLEHYKGYHFEHYAFLGKHDPLVRNGVKNWLKEKWL